MRDARKRSRWLRSLATLMAVVAASALALAWFRPTEQDRVLASAQAYLEARSPGAFRVRGASPQGGTPFGPGWTVTYGNAPGRFGGVVTGLLKVDPRGQVSEVMLLID